ncbi:MAG: hypothetical protein V9E98_03725, partial [Candidatus Nanopelagicales bacterium]
ERDGRKQNSRIVESGGSTTAQAVPATPGRRIGDLIEIAGELKAADRVVADSVTRTGHGAGGTGGGQMNIAAEDRAPLIRIRGLSKAYQRGDQASRCWSTSTWTWRTASSSR